MEAPGILGWSITRPSFPPEASLCAPVHGVMLKGRKSSVHDQLGSGDVRSLVGSQEQHGVAYLLPPAFSPHGNICQRLFRYLRIGGGDAKFASEA